MVLNTSQQPSTPPPLRLYWNGHTTFDAQFGQSAPGRKPSPLDLRMMHNFDLSVERMHRLMAFADKETLMPLYMLVAVRVLRRMAIDAKGAAFNYFQSKTTFEKGNLTKDQLGPLNLRLELLESFLDFSKAKERQDLKSVLNLDTGSLTIVDLTDPFMDPGTVCILFDNCLSLTEEYRPICGLVIALDEADKYMTKSLAAANLTQRLLGTIREQRHNGTRVIIATQEPMILEILLDLCTTSIIHRFSSPAWFASIQSHPHAASKVISSASERQAIFTQIMDLKIGESLVFSPSAFLCLTETRNVGNLGRTVSTIEIRLRIGRDGAMSMLVNAKANSDADTRDSSNTMIPTRPEKDVEVEQSSANGEVFDSKTCLSEDEFDDPREQGVVVVQPKKHLGRETNANILDRKRSDLVIICCSWRSQEGKEFYNDTIRTNQVLHSKPRAGLRLIFGDDMTGLTRDGHATYLFARVVQRSVKDGASLWTAPLVHIAGNSSPHIQLPRHQDGDFFKSSLRPNDSYD
ncbi:hypothetical protein LTR22_027438 [Elasticomyces elasticus]|nr:hypothetical protein LTR22_027438 [Elasticomyces elasticus]KAK4898305.1 hypothetical protein LTR49_027842 [Elasticomyces elasticus]KAK5745223.1 hypothetical protein LTS12_023196 [Elasticomyces elasticus]